MLGLINAEYRQPRAVPLTGNTVEESAETWTLGECTLRCDRCGRIWLRFNAYLVATPLCNGCRIYHLARDAIFIRYKWIPHVFAIHNFVSEVQKWAYRLIRTWCLNYLVANTHGSCQSTCSDQHCDIIWFDMWSFLNPRVESLVCFLSTSSSPSLGFLFFLFFSFLWLLQN